MKKDKKQEVVPVTLLGVEPLWPNLENAIRGLDEAADRAFALDPAERWPHSKFSLVHEDGRRVVVSRERNKNRIVLEVDKRGGYDRRDQGKLRRSFMETVPEILGREVGRQLGMLLKAYSPLYALREDQQAKKKVEHARQVRESIALAGLLGKGRPGKGAIELPDPEDDRNDYHRAWTTFRLTARPDQEARGEELVECSLQVTADGVKFNLEGPLSFALAATLAEALAPFVAREVACGEKKCERKCLEPAERTQRRCAEHVSEESGEGG